MSDDQTLYGALAVVAACVVYIVRFILTVKYVDKVGAFDKYKGYALIAAKYVEAEIPDDYGKEEDATGTAKSLAKLDLYLKKFTELVKENENTLPTEELVDMAKAWSVELVERLKK